MCITISANQLSHFLGFYFPTPTGDSRDWWGRNWGWGLESPCSSTRCPVAITMFSPRS